MSGGPPPPERTRTARYWKAGRKARYGVRMVQGSVSLTPAQWARLRALGEGNVSEGLRRLLARLGPDAPV